MQKVYEMHVQIASVSDLHIDFAINRNILVQLAAVIHARGADVVIIAGDVSHVDEHIAVAVRAFKVVAPHVVYLPGNHDLWLLNGGNNSWDRYRSTLPEIVQNEGGHYLPDAPFVVDQLALAGTTGWYDYSMMRPEYAEIISPEAVRQQKWKGIKWSDAKYTAFRDSSGELMSNESVARQMERELKAQLDELERRDSVKNVLVATHFLPFKASLGEAKGLPWDYFDAFMGSVSLGDTILSSTKVRHVVYGHTHRPNELGIEGMTVRGTPLGYPRERRHLSEDEIIERAIGWVEL